MTRPGRCLSLVDFPRFSKEEATLWLGAPAPSATLAELYQQDETGIVASEPERIGAYL